MDYKFHHSILGGTFDHFHSGHRFFLNEAFKKSQFVTIGIAQKNLISNKKLFKAIEPINLRIKSLTSFLKKSNFYNRTKIIKINNIYGTSLTDKTLEAIFVTEQNIENAKLINQKRGESGLPLLKIVQIPLITNTDKTTISSTAIRQGRMDRDGKSVKNYFEGIKDLIVTNSLRKELSKPFGKVMDSKSFDAVIRTNGTLLSVGDITTYHFIKAGKTPDVVFFDLKTKRTAITNPEVIKFLPSEYITLSNPKGTIHVDTAIKINTSVHQALKNNKKIAIKIDGEEDLLTLIAILIAPLNSNVIYGLQGKGMMLVRVTEEIKNSIRTKFINKFKKIKE